MAYMFRTDVTEDYSSPQSGQVNDHHQPPDLTSKRLDPWTGQKYT